VRSKEAAAGGDAGLGDRVSDLFNNPDYVDLVHDVVATKAFRRLKDIRFLGAIDYVVSSGRANARPRHTRYEHSLGVGMLAHVFSKRANLSATEEKHLVVAALLHDIGHGPLSHSLEPAFKGRFHLNHHEASSLIIKGAVPLGAELPEIFRRHAISVAEIVKLVSCEGEGLYAEALNSPINIDTVEAILRASTYITSPGNLERASKIIEALVNRGTGDVAILDEFWRLKGLVYEVLISSSLGVVADRLCQAYFERFAPKFWGGTFFLSETALRKEHPKLFEHLEKLRMSRAQVLGGDTHLLEYYKRKFYIEEHVQIDSFSDLYLRYRQRRVPVQVRVGEFFKEGGSTGPAEARWKELWKDGGA
jgi:hypothetical protein